MNNGTSPLFLLSKHLFHGTFLYLNKITLFYIISFSHGLPIALQYLLKRAEIHLFLMFEG
jgi:hypothetical protein